MRAVPETNPAHAAGIAYVSIAICGENDVVESNADEQLRVEVEGGTLLAFGSANPAPTESFLTGTYTTYRGWAQAIVYRAEPGTATLVVRSETLPQATVRVEFA